MVEQNNQPTQPKVKGEVCTIRIMFPVTSDEQAIDYKKKIANVLSDNDDVVVDFRLSTLPAPPPKM